MGAKLLFPIHLLACILDADPPIFEKLHTLLEVFLDPGKIKHQDPFFSGKHGCVEDIKGQIIISDQGTDNGFMHDIF